MTEKPGTVFLFTLYADDAEPVHVCATARDVLAWERAAKGRSFSDILDGRSYADNYELAYYAAKRDRIFTKGLSDFEAAYEVLPGHRGGENEEEEESEAPDPFQKEA